MPSLHVHVGCGRPQKLSPTLGIEGAWACLGRGWWWWVAKRLQEGALVTAAWQRRLPLLPPSPPSWPLASQEALWASQSYHQCLPLDVGWELWLGPGVQALSRYAEVQGVCLSQGHRPAEYLVQRPA